MYNQDYVMTQISLKDKVSIFYGKNFSNYRILIIICGLFVIGTVILNGNQNPLDTQDYNGKKLNFNLTYLGDTLHTSNNSTDTDNGFHNGGGSDLEDSLTKYSINWEAAMVYLPYVIYAFVGGFFLLCARSMIAKSCRPSYPSSYDDDYY